MERERDERMEKGGEVASGREEEKSKEEGDTEEDGKRKRETEGKEGDGKRENDEMSAMMKVACVCVVNARIQLFCDYNATGDWTVG